MPAPVSFQRVFQPADRKPYAGSVWPLSEHGGVDGVFATLNRCAGTRDAHKLILIFSDGTTTTVRAKAGEVAR